MWNLGYIDGVANMSPKETRDFGVPADYRNYIAGYRSGVRGQMQDFNKDYALDSVKKDESPGPG